MSTKSSARVKQKRRLGEHWVSTNRVLNASKKGGSFGRNPNFDTDETKLLIQLWGDPKVQRTLITTHKKHAVICQLATKMQEYGYYRSAEEITTRIKNLKCFYNRLKKDMEAGQASTNEPTWKHFGEMDAIMTRPIFSVRPNEVPAPSLKYQLEKAQEEREERRRKILEEGGSPSDESDEGLDDIVALNKCQNNSNEIDDGIIPDVEVDIDLNNEAFVAICGNGTQKMVPTQKKRKLMKSNESILPDAGGGCEFEDFSPDESSNAASINDTTNTLTQIKEEHTSNDGSEAATVKTATIKKAPSKHVNATSNTNAKDDNSAALLIPKEEPIDVDADDDSCDKESTPTSTSIKAIMPTLADILHMSKGSNVAISSSGIIIPVSSTTTNASLASSRIATTAVNATPTISTETVHSAAQGKISLVPTNFLMQPPKPTVPPTHTLTSPLASIQAQPQSQQIHLLPNSIGHQLQGQLQQRLLLSGGHAAGTALNTNGMKVLLVNAEQANQMLPLNNTILQKQQQTQAQHLKQQQQHEEQLKKKQKHEEQHEKQKNDEFMSKKDATGMRILLRQLLNAQTENNEIQHQRLSIERERLDFEKNIAERFLTMLPTLFAEQQKQPQQHPIQLTQSSTAQLRLTNPPKLLFTTAVPPTVTPIVNHTVSTGATLYTTAAASTLTTSLPKVSTTTTKPVEICTQINDLKLLTPKEENDI